VAKTIYGAGIACNTFIAISYHNKDLVTSSNKYNTKITYVDYWGASFQGLVAGACTGIWWPITAIGQVVLKIDAVSNNK
jgi:hypothetical protein